QKESVSKQGRKNAKGDGKAKENAQSEGRTKEMMDEDKETDEVGLSTEDEVSTAKEGVSTDFEKVSTDEQMESNDDQVDASEEIFEGSEDQRECIEEKVESTAEQKESTEEQTKEEIATQASQTSTQTPSSMIFGDDETIATLLINMSKAKTASKEKEKGIELKDVEDTDRPRPTSTRSTLTLKPLPKIDPKDKGKKKIEEEDETESEDDDIPQAVKKFKQLESDEELARKVQEEWEAEEERNKIAEEQATNEALIKDFDDIKARIEADRILAEKLQEQEREQFTIEERAKFLHDTIAAQRKFLAQQRSQAIRNKPPTKNQLRNQMITYLKHIRCPEVLKSSFGRFTLDLFNPDEQDEFWAHSRMEKNQFEVAQFLRKKVPMALGIEKIISRRQKNWLVHKQTAWGKDFSNPLMVYNLPKIVRLSSFIGCKDPFTIREPHKPTPTKILHFEEPDESQVNTAQVNTAEVDTAALNTGETERVQRRKGKDPMTEEDLQAEVQASKKSKELQELADLEEAQRLQATMDAETQRQIDLDALLAYKKKTKKKKKKKNKKNDQILAEKIQQEEREQYSIEERAKFLHDTIAAQRKFLAEQRSAAIRNKPPTISQLRNRMSTYSETSLYERYKKQDQTFVAIGTEEDERAIKRMNEKATDKEEEKKDESVHEEVKEAEGAKKRKLGTRRKLKAKRRKHTSGLTREDDDLKICLHIAPDEDKVIDVESLDHQYPIVEWQSFFLTTKPQFDQTKPDEDIYLNKVTRSNGHQRFFRTLMGVLSILDREDLKTIYELVMEEYKDRLPEGFDRMLWGDLMIMFNQGDTADFWDTQQNWKLISWKLHSSSGVHTIMTSTGLVIHMFVENRYPLAKEVLSNMLELKLETEEESSMALELIKFVKQQLEEFEDSNDDDLVTSDHGEEERV
ncbi:hypothetical protein Tco_1367637, partial [Tanacetum coccineum]